MNEEKVEYLFRLNRSIDRLQEVIKDVYVEYIHICIRNPFSPLMNYLILTLCHWICLSIRCTDEYVNNNS